MIRSSVRDYSYSSDYRELADQRSITILLIHHTRKMGDSDVMNTVSSTNAIFIRSSCAWEGRTKELMGEPGIDSVSPTVFGKYLAQHSMFLEKNGVRYSKRRTPSGSLVTLERIGDGDSNDGNP